jgi:hypothetical protein
MSINGGLINGFAINSGGGSGITFPPFYVPALFEQRISIEMLISGEADSLEDVLIPISRLSGSMGAEGSYKMTAVIPDGFSFGSDINARSNGFFAIQTTVFLADGSSREIFSNAYSDFTIESTKSVDSWVLTISGEYVPPEIAPIFGVVTLERFSFTGGTNQQILVSQGGSGTSSGSGGGSARTPYRVREYTDPPILIQPGGSIPPINKYDAIGQFSERIDSSGKRSVQCALNASLRPLDILILYNTVEIEVGSIDYNITDSNAVMTVTEI